MNCVEGMSFVISDLFLLFLEHWSLLIYYSLLNSGGN